ncbi:hypothetical protein D3C71_1332760 [compost metagenome]
MKKNVGIPWWLAYILTAVIVLFIFYVVISGFGYRNAVYTVYWEKPNGETVVFNRVNRLESGTNLYEFVDLSTNEHISISGGLVKTILVEKKFNPNAWLGDYSDN